MRKIEEIIVHCTASPNNMDAGMLDVDRWHADRGFGTEVYGRTIHCGYTYVIRRNGVAEVGRPESVMGAHCKGRNSYSIGIVLVGNDQFTPEQFSAFRSLVGDLRERYGNIPVRPHNFYNHDKTCPNFNVEEALKP